MSIDFHRLMEPIDINRLIFIDYIDYIDCFPMIDFHRLDPSGIICESENQAENRKNRGTDLEKYNSAIWHLSHSTVYWRRNIW